MTSERKSAGWAPMGLDEIMTCAAPSSKTKRIRERWQLPARKSAVVSPASSSFRKLLTRIQGSDALGVSYTLYALHIMHDGPLTDHAWLHQPES